MSELAGFGTDWLPPSVQRRIADEDARERAAGKREEAVRADVADQAHDRALSAYRAAAEARGEVVSAVALATGADMGRTVGDVFADALAAAEREDGRAAARQRHEDGDTAFIGGEPVIHGASRSDGWPESPWELDRMLRDAGQLHSDLVAHVARRDYPAAEEAARAKSSLRHTAGTRSQSAGTLERAARPGREISR